MTPAGAVKRWFYILLSSGARAHVLYLAGRERQSKHQIFPSGADTIMAILEYRIKIGFLKENILTAVLYILAPFYAAPLYAVPMQLRGYLTADFFSSRKYLVKRGKPEFSSLMSIVLLLNRPPVVQ